MDHLHGVRNHIIGLVEGPERGEDRVVYRPLNQHNFLKGIDLLGAHPQLIFTFNRDPLRHNRSLEHLFRLTLGLFLTN
jgi:hypothetical protein